MNPEEIISLKGWDFLDGEKVKALRGKAAESQHALDVLCARTFATIEGKRFLKWMVQQTVLMPTGDANATERGAGIAEGRNDFVRQILMMIERSKRGPK